MFRNALNNRVKPDYLVQICQFPPKIWIFGFVCLIFFGKPGFIRFSGFTKNPYLTPRSRRLSWGVPDGADDGGRLLPAAPLHPRGEEERPTGQQVRRSVRSVAVKCPGEDCCQCCQNSGRRLLSMWSTFREEGVVLT